MQVNIKTTSIDDVTEITSPDWNGKIITVTRFSYDAWRNSTSIPQTASIYVLTSNRYNAPGEKHSIYIGHTESISTRIDNHVSNKDFWTAAFIFTSQEDWMNIAFTKNIEHQFINLAKLANRYTVTNANDGGFTHLGKEDSKKLVEFVSGAKAILKIARMDFFEPNMSGVFTKTFNLGGVINPKECSLYITEINTTEKTLNIKEGSKIPYHYIKDNDEMKSLDGLVVNDDLCEFTKKITTKYDNYTLIKIYDSFTLFDCVSENGIKLSTFIRKNSK